VFVAQPDRPATWRTAKVDDPGTVDLPAWHLPNPSDDVGS